jgi:hypothetical protein
MGQSLVPEPPAMIYDLIRKPDHFGHCFGQFPDGAVDPRTNIDVGQILLRMGLIGFCSQLHDMDTGRGHIIHMQKFTYRFAGSPGGNLFFGAALAS